MDRKFVGAMLLFLASGGCRMCSNCCDNLPPVLDGPYPYTEGRAGSAFGAASHAEPYYEAEPIGPSAAEQSPAEDS